MYYFWLDEILALVTRCISFQWVAHRQCPKKVYTLQSELFEINNNIAYSVKFWWLYRSLLLIGLLYHHGVKGHSSLLNTSPRMPKWSKGISLQAIEKMCRQVECIESYLDYGDTLNWLQHSSHLNRIQLDGQKSRWSFFFSSETSRQAKLRWLRDEGRSCTSIKTRNIYAARPRDIQMNE